MTTPSEKISLIANPPPNEPYTHTDEDIIFMCSLQGAGPKQTAKPHTGPKTKATSNRKRGSLDKKQRSIDKYLSCAVPGLQATDSTQDACTPKRMKAKATTPYLNSKNTRSTINASKANGKKATNSDQKNVQNDREPPGPNIHPPADKWVYPEAVGLLCHAQVACMCAVHTINADAGRPTITGEELIKKLETELPTAENEIVKHNSSGNFTLMEINRYLYWYSPSPVALVPLFATGFPLHTEGGGHPRIRDKNGNQVKYPTQHEILEALPQGCTSIWINELTDGFKHFYLRQLSPVDNNWYEVDSIPYASSGQIKATTAQDWAKTETVYCCIVELDAYLYQLTDIRLPRQHRQQLPHDRSTLKYISLSQIQLSHVRLPKSGDTIMHEAVVRPHAQSRPQPAPLPELPDKEQPQPQGLKASSRPKLRPFQAAGPSTKVPQKPAIPISFSSTENPVPQGFSAQAVDHFNTDIYQAGSCLFESIAYIELTAGCPPNTLPTLEPVRQRALELRELTGAYIAENHDTPLEDHTGPAAAEDNIPFSDHIKFLAGESGYKEIIRPGQEVASYVEHLMMDPYATGSKALWGDNICLKGLHHALNKASLHVYTFAHNTPDQLNLLKIEDPHPNSNKPTYHLLHRAASHTAEHFMPLVQLGNQVGNPVSLMSPPRPKHSAINHAKENRALQKTTLKRPPSASKHRDSSEHAHKKTKGAFPLIAAQRGEKSAPTPAQQPPFTLGAKCKPLLPPTSSIKRSTSGIHPPIRKHQQPAEGEAVYDQPPPTNYEHADPSTSYAPATVKRQRNIRARDISSYLPPAKHTPSSISQHPKKRGPEPHPENTLQQSAIPTGFHHVHTQKIPADATGQRKKAKPAEVPTSSPSPLTNITAHFQFTSKRPQEPTPGNNKKAPMSPTCKTQLPAQPPKTSHVALDKENSPIEPHAERPGPKDIGPAASDVTDKETKAPHQTAKIDDQIDPHQKAGPETAQSSPHNGNQARMQCLTLNLRGLWTSMGLIQDIIKKHGPDIVVFTETKLRPRKQNPKWAHAVLRDYHIIHSKCGTNHRVAQAGIMIAIHKRLCPQRNQISNCPIPAHCSGHLLPLIIQRPLSRPLLLTGVYMPQTSLEQKTVQTAMSAVACQHPEHLLITAGDFNAALYPNDRASAVNRVCKSRIDQQHRALSQTLKLSSIDAPIDTTPRPYTYRSETYANGYTYKSRIDDILISVPQEELRTHATIEVVSTEGQLTDHQAVLAQLPYSLLKQLPPLLFETPEAKPVPQVKLVTPLKPKLALTSATTDRIGHQIQRVKQDLRKIMEDEVLPHWEQISSTDARTPNPLTHVQSQASQTVVDTIGEQISELFQAMLPIAHDVCETKNTNPTGMKHRTRSAQRKRKKLRQQRCTLAALRQGNAPNCTDSELAQTMSDLRTQVPDSEDLSEQELLARTETKTYMANLKTQQVHLDRKEQTYARQKHIKSLQELADKNQKLGNKIFTGAKHESLKECTEDPKH